MQCQQHCQSCIRFVEVFMHATFTATEAEVQMNSVERCMHYTLEVPEEPAWEATSSKGDGGEKGEEKVEAVPENWPEHGAISIKDLVVGYRKGPDVLKGISMDIRAGEKIGSALFAS